MRASVLSSRLREVVHQSVALLGGVVRKELGASAYQRIEDLRERMARLRSVSKEASFRHLQDELQRLRRVPSRDRIAMARAYTLMLELMNACENAYRSQVIRERALSQVRRETRPMPDAVIYVLTAHPTEARAPGNIWVFHEILRALTSILARPDVKFTEFEQKKLQHLLEIAWKTSVVRSRKPRVEDEAEHIYSTLLRDETLRTLLRAREELTPIYIRSWVGGDKDGHPGVDENVFLHSLTLSRRKILDFVVRRLAEVETTLRAVQNEELLPPLAQTKKIFLALRSLQNSDAGRVMRARAQLDKTIKQYASVIGAVHPSLSEIKSLIAIFPALVVPLEFRESSDVLLSSPTGKGLAIFRMLQTLARISKGADPRWYVRGFIVSMASRIDHLQIAGAMTKRALGDISLPIIPLFEQAGALDDGARIASEMLADRALASALKKHWNGQLEIMLGYSDSSKESGVLKSRIKVAETMHRLDRLVTRKGIVPIFFQGSGGSTDRGGGSVEEQTGWWSPSALRNYKVTIQGEMVERSLANPEITFGQLERIAKAAGEWREVARHRRLAQDATLDDFAERVAINYRAKVSSDVFLQVIELATPYRFLDQLRFGSRPTKRSRKVSVEGLRAIPWILCWTQTRILFPTWWGVGRAWHDSTPVQRRHLIRLAKSNPVFATYVRALGYTLLKIESPVWRTYIEASELSEDLKKSTWRDFEIELRAALQFAYAVTKSRNLVAWRPWLAESIHLRSPMIHPLNLLQIIAMQTKDVELLRLTVAGISSGMMTTG